MMYAQSPSRRVQPSVRTLHFFFFFTCHTILYNLKRDKKKTNYKQNKRCLDKQNDLLMMGDVSFYVTQNSINQATILGESRLPSHPPYNRHCSLNTILSTTF